MKRPVLLVLLLLACLPLSARAAEEVIPPAWPVPDYVRYLLDVAGEEVGYTEGEHGYTKYGEWAGDPYCQWCAEYLCWCVDQVDQRYGTALLNQVYPRYSGSNTGRNWYIRAGRYIARNGNLEDWGYQWLDGAEEHLSTGDYIPQPGDWVFFTWTSDQSTDHVAMVEYCTRNERGDVTLHVLEGNTPSAVIRTEYPITYTRILGYGTVHDAAHWTCRYGNVGAKVEELQNKLVRAGYLAPESVTGTFGSATQEAVRAFQRDAGLNTHGVANREMQTLLDARVREIIISNPASWVVTEDGRADDFMDGFDFP